MTQTDLTRPLVAIIGSSTPEGEALRAAEEVGRAVGNRNWHLLTGGGGGTMEAACRGFRSAPERESAVAVGILPTDDMDFANEYVDIPIPTGIGLARNAIIARAAKGLIAIGGETGTLSEIAFAWQMHKPIVAIAGTGGWSDRLAGATLDNRRTDRVHRAETPEAAIRYLAGVFENDGV